MADEQRLVGGSRRPDGTLRKERRVRPGYVPQDEQPVYQSVGTLRKQGVPKCPGLDPDAASTPSGPKTKAAKKNEKRKQKKADGSADGSESSSQPAAAASAEKSGSSSAPAANANGQATAAAAAAAADTSPAAVLDKQIKALSKKLRQCISLEQRKAAGEVLSPQELEKVSKMAGWQEEVLQLEHQLARLQAA